ncbi:NAD(P)-binding protein [Bradyrhizobium sp. BRP19]|uniref:NAD(P)-binding protein n=1 Tax=Bradyrhizobium sp. BRP19 TaxID=2793823 RepID=UPI001CD37EB0|nr:NAD(P)-binding protein [Bradyrhizobium sp. BRP19]MCA1549975.1 NAD(P)-binding protein [Bradyrhizobium sp. BRP19]
MAKRKVAVLGGGIAALSAAFELIELDPGGERFDITVYTLGWRLGGKGAVGRRGPDCGYRGEEHGLHVWTGFYDNSFYLVDRCYDGLRRLGYAIPFGSRDAAFCALDRCTLMEESAGPWHFDLPRHSGTPGKFEDGKFVTLVDYLQSLIRRSADYVMGADFPAEFRISPLDPTVQVTTKRLVASFEAARVEADKLPEDPRDISFSQSEILQQNLRCALGALREYQATSAVTRDDLRRAFILIELAFTIALGMLADGVIWHGFDHIDDLEWSEWMRSHLCSEPALSSAVVRGCYDYVFGYLRGNRNVGAGTGTRVLLKLVFGYRGSFFYIMKATMGELVFAPLYQLLRARGVKFEFFHRVDRLTLSADASIIEEIDIGVQATTVGNFPYCPLVSMPDGAGGTLPTWPAHPKYELLNNGHAMEDYDLESAWTDWRDADRKTLELGRDFDVVVLGIPVGELERICAELVHHLPAWRRMIEAIRTTPTMALQLWTTASTPQLGWKGGDQTILSAFAKPLDSWGDLSLMLSMESWHEERPRGLAYFVGSFPEPKSPPPASPNPDFPKRELERAREYALEWIHRNLPEMWPSGAASKGSFQWNLLFDPENRQGIARFAAQYLRVNINPSDRYVLSVAGSLTKRMTADDSGVENLYLAGDWVRTGINAGCVEASVMAGRSAAGAIRGVRIAMPNATDFDDFNFPIALVPGLQLLREVAGRTAGGVGDIDAFCAILDAPIETVRAMLPTGMKLHTTGSAASHQVVLVFARQRNVRPGFLPFGGTSYCEIFNIIPDIELENIPYLRRVRFSFMPILLLDQLAPVLVGQTLYGFNKQHAQIHVNSDSFDVRGRVARISAHFDREGVPGDISRFPDIVAVRKKIEQPLVGLATDGSYICSIVDMHLDAATFQHATGKLQIGRPFVNPPISVEMHATPGDGAWGFHFRSRWSLSLPLQLPPQKGNASALDARSLVAGYSQAMFGRFPFGRSR